MQSMPTVPTPTRLDPELISASTQVILGQSRVLEAFEPTLDAMHLEARARVEQQRASASHEDELHQASGDPAEEAQEETASEAQEQRDDLPMDPAALGSTNDSSGVKKPTGSRAVRPTRIPPTMAALRQSASPASTSGAGSTTTLRTGPTALTAAAPVTRGVPAAALRAIEVEATLNASGVKASPGPSRLTAIEGRSMGGRPGPMGQAELRTLQGMTTLLARRGGHIRVLLEPVQLGPVTIEIDVQGDRVRARIETSTRSASKVLDAASSRLKAALESQGFTLERFEVRQEGASESTSNADDNADDSGQEDHHLQQDGDRPRRAWTWRRPVVSDEHFDLAALAAKEASA